MFKNAGSLSTEINEDCSSIPSNIHDVESPVPVPSSSILPAGFEAANVRSKEQVSTSEAIEKPEAAVASTISLYAFG